MRQFVGALTSEQQKRIQRLAHVVWNEVSSDVPGPVSRNEVLELVSDAGRMQQLAHPVNDADLLPFLNDATQAQMNEVLRDAFPAGGYE